MNPGWCVGHNPSACQDQTLPQILRSAQNDLGWFFSPPPDPSQGRDGRLPRPQPPGLHPDAAQASNYTLVTLGYPSTATEKVM